MINWIIAIVAILIVVATIGNFIKKSKSGKVVVVAVVVAALQLTNAIQI